MFEENILRSFVRRVNPAITIDKIHLEEHGNAPYWSNYNQFLNTYVLSVPLSRYRRNYKTLYGEKTTHDLK